MTVRRRSKLRRWLRRAARLLVAFGVVLTLLGNAGAVTAAVLAERAAVPACKCPHRDDKPKCCCAHGDEGDRCLPASGCSAGFALAEAVLGALVPYPVLAGTIDQGDVPALKGRDDRLRLERPPRV